MADAELEEVHAKDKLPNAVRIYLSNRVLQIRKARLAQLQQQGAGGRGGGDGGQEEQRR